MTAHYILYILPRQFWVANQLTKKLSLSWQSWLFKRLSFFKACTLDWIKAGFLVSQPAHAGGIFWDVYPAMFTRDSRGWVDPDCGLVKIKRPRVLERTRTLAWRFASLIFHWHKATKHVHQFHERFFPQSIVPQLPQKDIGTPCHSFCQNKTSVRSCSSYLFEWFWMFSNEFQIHVQAYLLFAIPMTYAQWFCHKDESRQTFFRSIDYFSPESFDSCLQSAREASCSQEIFPYSVSISFAIIWGPGLRKQSIDEIKQIQPWFLKYWICRLGVGNVTAHRHHLGIRTASSSGGCGEHFPSKYLAYAHVFQASKRNLLETQHIQKGRMPESITCECQAFPEWAGEDAQFLR